jgi:hypothetical protein
MTSTYNPIAEVTKTRTDRSLNLIILIKPVTKEAIPHVPASTSDSKKRISIGFPKLIENVSPPWNAPESPNINNMAIDTKSTLLPKTFAIDDDFLKTMKGGPNAKD